MHQGFGYHIMCRELLESAAKRVSLPSSYSDDEKSPQIFTLIRFRISSRFIVLRDVKFSRVTETFSLSYKINAHSFLL